MASLTLSQSGLSTGEALQSDKPTLQCYGCDQEISPSLTSKGYQLSCHGVSWCSISCAELYPEVHDVNCLDQYFHFLEGNPTDACFLAHLEETVVCKFCCKQILSPGNSVLLCFRCLDPLWCSSQCALKDDHLRSCLGYFRLSNNLCGNRRCANCFCSVQSGNINDETNTSTHCSTCQDDDLRTTGNNRPAPPVSGSKKESSTENSSSEGLPSSLQLQSMNELKKQGLLSEAIAHAAKQLENGFTLLERMKMIDPIEARNFVPKTETIASFQLRLLSRDTETMPNITGFIAISYCWHSADWQTIPQLTPTTEFPLANEMWQFIMHQMLLGNEGVWIDQICIKQDDEVEKMSAISAMDLVYRNARVVVIVLEDISLTTNEWEAMTCFYPFVTHDDSGKSEVWQLARSFLQAANIILSSRWFTRAWCNHEFLCNRNSELLIFVKTIGIQRYKLRTLLNTILATSIITPFNFVSLVSSRLSALDRLTQDYASTGLSSDASGKNHWEVFRHCLSMRCSNEYDKLSIFLNLAETGLAYTSKPTDGLLVLFYSASLVALAAGDVDFLSHSTPEHIPDEWKSSHGYQTISWMPLIPLPPVSFDVLPMPSAKVHTNGGDITCRWSKMKLEIIKFTNSRGLRVEKAYRDAAERLFREVESINDESVQKHLSILESVPIDIIAATIKLGLSWILQFSGDTRRKMASNIRECSNSSFNKWKEPDKVSVVNFMRQILEQTSIFQRDSSAQTVDPTSDEFILGLLWIISIYGYWADSPSLDKIINLDQSAPGFFGLTNLGKSQWERLRNDGCILAMPKVMTDARFSLHDRLWVLKPTSNDSNPSFQIFSKHMVLGFADISESTSRPRSSVEILSWHDESPLGY